MTSYLILCTVKHWSRRGVDQAEAFKWLNCSLQTCPDQARSLCGERAPWFVGIDQDQQHFSNSDHWNIHSRESNVSNSIVPCHFQRVTLPESAPLHTQLSHLCSRGEWLLLCLCARLGRATVLEADEYPRAAAARL